MENLEKENRMVVIPSGICCANCCGDCNYMDLSYKNNYGEAWCGKYEKYYHPSENASSCRYFSQK